MTCIANIASMMNQAVLSPRKGGGGGVPTKWAIITSPVCVEYKRKFTQQKIPRVGRFSTIFLLGISHFYVCYIHQGRVVVQQ